MSSTVAIGTTGVCRRCGEPIEYIACSESDLWTHRGRHGEWPSWCDPKLCHAEPEPSIEVHTYGKVAYVGAPLESFVVGKNLCAHGYYGGCAMCGQVNR